MVLAAQAVKMGKLMRFFCRQHRSAISSGSVHCRPHQNVERPGLMSTLPVMGEPDKGFDMLDLGANADNKPEHLVQYAVLGSFYAEKVRNVQNPRVGLLNNGTEETKGSELTKKPSNC